MLKIAVIGLGSMGYGMAQSLLRAGHEVLGIDVNPDAVARFRAEGGSPAELEENARSLDAVVCVVLNAAQLEEVLFGERGIAHHLAKETVIIACPTIPPEAARDFAARTDALGLLYLDAPISGGSVKAAAGALSIMASGSEATFTAAAPVLDATAETVFKLGTEVGAGSAMKAVNQLLAGVHIAAMAEALTFGMTQGISPRQFLDVIPKCAGTSWMLENRAPHIVAGDYAPHSSVAIWPKDLGIVQSIAEASNHPTPLTDAALAQFQSAVAAGLASEDDAAVAKIYAAATGQALP
jgi:3-hydroxyisobutyrate dehydrogenase-like beta-hydroxyacid dehydrogenase